MTTATETKHTPGPWTTPHDDSPFWLQAGLNESDLPVSSEHGRICTVDSDRRCWAANARLIAAAPQLLEACQSILDHWNSGNFSREPELWDGLRAAIDAATK